MKIWILVLIIASNSNPGGVATNKIVGWYNKAGCERAGRALKSDFRDISKVVKYSCIEVDAKEGIKRGSNNTSANNYRSYL